MFDKLFAMLKLDDPASPQSESKTQGWSLAASALMIEVATADQSFDNTELDALLVILAREFMLTPDQLDSLVLNAKQQSKDATSLYQFTRQVNDDCSNQEKYRLMLGLWQVAYADGSLDKYEEHIIRRIADLIHLPHTQFMRAKHEAKANAN